MKITAFLDLKTAAYENLKNSRQHRGRKAFKKGKRGYFYTGPDGNPGSYYDAGPDINGFQAGSFFGGNRGPQSHDEFYDYEYTDLWEKHTGWDRSAEKSKKSRKKKSKKKTKKKKKDPVSEFYAKVLRSGGGDVTIDGKVYNVQIVDGELQVRELDELNFKSK